MLCTFISRALGFVRIAVVGALFGGSGEADVLNAVFTIPNNLRKLLAEGALSSAFIPVLSSCLIEDPTGKKAKDITRNIITFQFVIIIPIILLSIIFAKPVVATILDFPEQEKMALSARVFQWFIGYLLLISVSAVIMGVLNSHNSFFIPALTPIFFSVAVIASTIVFYKTLGIFSMALGVLAGGLGQVVFQLPFFGKLGYDLRPDFFFRRAEFRQVMKQWLPVVATASIYTINEMIAVKFATGLEDGSASALSNALVFWQLPFGIFSASITTVLFPRMSKQSAANDVSGLRESFSYGVRFLLVLLVPSSIIMSLLGKEIIAIAIQRGEFTRANTLLTAQVLTGYNIGLFSAGLFSFMQRFFYSVKDFKAPLITAILASVIDIGFSLWLKETPLRVTGLAVANSLAFSIGAVVFLVMARKRLERIDGKHIAKTLGKVIAAQIPMVLFLIVFLRLTGPWWSSGSTMKNVLLLCISGIGSVLIVLGMYAVLKIEMLSIIFKRRRKVI